jgi:hypothetical protein
VDHRRRAEEKEANGHGLTRRWAFGELTEHLEVALRVRVLGDGALELGRIDLHVGAGEFAHLLELLRRPRRLGGAAATDDDDLLQRGLGDRLDRGVRRVRGLELLAGQREHSRDVEGDVAVPDHDGAVDVQVELEVLVIRVAVVPGDELGGRRRARKVFARDPEALVGLRANRVDHSVVEARQVLVRQAAADLDVADEPVTRLGGDALERARDGL